MTAVLGSSDKITLGYKFGVKIKNLKSKNQINYKLDSAFICHLLTCSKDST